MIGLALAPLRELKRSLLDPAVIVASLGASVAALALPMAMIQIYDRIIPNQGFSTLAALGIIVLVAILVEFGLRSARGMILSQAGAKFEIEGYRAAAAALLDEDPSKARDDRHGDLMTRLTAIDRLRDLHAGPTSGALLDLPMALVFLGLVSIISPLVAGAMTLLLAASFIHLKRKRARVRDLHRERLEIEARRQSFLTEVLDKVDTVRSLRIEDQMERRHERLLARSGEITDQLVASIHSAKSFAASVGMAAPLIVALTGAWLFTQDALTIGSLAATVILTGRIVQPVLQFEAYVAGADNARVAAEDYRVLVDRTPRKGGDVPMVSAKTLELIDVSTDPEDDTGVAFQNISVRFERGSCSHIKAPSKMHGSAFLRLIAGEIALTRGAILIDGKDLADYRVEDRLAAIRLLTAPHRLLTGTLMENLTNFSGHRYQETALNLAREIGLDQHVIPTVEGYGMSVGQSEKDGLPRSLADALGMVSALVTDPDIILFDEPNVALDRETDARLLEMVKGWTHKKTVIMMTSRPSFARLADREIDISQWVASGEEVAA
ncbi:MAG: ABC transporter transmembrane domain-containing protein [Pseudomonadota bacterium]